MTIKQLSPRASLSGYRAIDGPTLTKVNTLYDAALGQLYGIPLDMALSTPVKSILHPPHHHIIVPREVDPLPPALPPPSSERSAMSLSNTTHRGKSTVITFMFARPFSTLKSPCKCTVLRLTMRSLWNHWIDLSEAWIHAQCNKPYYNTHTPFSVARL
jgi:hypothetical protein